MSLGIKVATIRAVSPTVRDSFQLKWTSIGCSSVDYVVSKNPNGRDGDLKPVPIAESNC